MAPPFPESGKSSDLEVEQNTSSEHGALCVSEQDNSSDEEEPIGSEVEEAGAEEAHDSEDHSGIFEV